jgi:hypothetical protein
VRRITWILAAVFGVGSFAAQAVAAEKRPITCSFWEDGESRAYFELYLVPGQKQRVLIYRKRVLELSADEAGSVQLRVLNQWREPLYTAQLDGPRARSFRLAACGNEFELANSANTRSPSSCEQRGAQE